MNNKIIKVGLDFDGVVAYNPFRVARALVSFVKRDMLGMKKISFWYPQARWQQFFWTLAHESSIFPAKGTELFKKMVSEGKIEAHLVTARYSFLDNHLYDWLTRYKLTHLFKTITLNKQDEQPHIFKEKIIEKKKFDYFIEDNWDIVKYLSKKRKAKSVKCKIYWIYNILDHFKTYPHKFPYLEKALEDIERLLIVNG